MFFFYDDRLFPFFKQDLTFEKNILCTKSIEILGRIADVKIAMNAFVKIEFSKLIVRKKIC